MGRVIADQSVSLDGFSAGPTVRIGNGMGDGGEEPWGDPPPFHNNPVFVVTHRPKAPVVKQGGTTYTFVTDGLDATLARAREAAGGRDVVVLGGADVIRQCIKAGLPDELQIHLVHVLLGDGTRFFGDLDAASATFECNRVIDAEGVTHLRFRLVK